MADKAVESGEKKKSKSTYQKDRKILGRKKERRKKKKAKMNNPATRAAGCQERMLDMELFFSFFFHFPSVLIAFSCFISHRDKQVLGSLLEGSLGPVWPGPASSGSLSQLSPSSPATAARCHYYIEAIVWAPTLPCHFRSRATFPL